MFRLIRSNWCSRIALLGVVLIPSLLAACAQQEATPGQVAGAPAAADLGIQRDSGKLEVGFITVGPVSDWGYNYAHNQGRLAMEARLRGRVHTVIVENVPETADVERVMERMANAGAG